ncbi:MAG: metallophosphoesterase [Bacteroidota bacterium]
MSKNLVKGQSSVAAAMDTAFRHALEHEQAEGRTVIDLQGARIVIFSDHHRGNRDGADDFRRCERAYNAALAYYYPLGYTLVVMGDVEELWEEWPKTVTTAYAHTLELEGKFHQQGRYIRIWGNHDDAWQHPDLVEQWLIPALGGAPLKVQEALILHVREGEEELGRLFLVHGHQGTFDSDRIAPISRLFVRYVWRPIQRIIKRSFNTPAKDFELRHVRDTAMYLWSECQEKVVMVAGHTHRPVFKSQSQEAIIRRSLEAAEAELTKEPDNVQLQQQTAQLAAELEWTLAQNWVRPEDMPPVEFRKPSYFNAGCCAFLDGDVTALELNGGEIQLVRWPDDEAVPKPKVLVSTKLKDVFKAC